MYLALQSRITVYNEVSGDNSLVSTSRDITSTGAISASELFNIFHRKNSRFPVKYKVYVYFRDQGCCVHTAVNYGLDYSVYQDLPSRCHSAFSVLVVDGVNERTKESTDDEPHCKSLGICPETLRWNHISAMTRVMGVCNSIK